MSKKNASNSVLSRLYRYLVLSTIGWTLIVAGSLAWTVLTSISREACFTENG